MTKNWRWQKMTFSLVAIIGLDALCYCGKLGPEMFSALFLAVCTLWGYQKKQEMEYKNQQNVNGG